jgi:DNA-binding NarL/FixJ family response regulator
MATLMNNVIYILSPQKLQSELMAYFLEREADMKCVNLSDSSRIPPPDNADKNTSTLILLECPNKDLVKYFMEIESSGRKILSHYRAAFFNVQPGLGIEEKALGWGIRGFFYERDSLGIFLKGIRAIFNGEMWLSREIMTKYILDQKSHNNSYRKELVVLTQRELEILTMVVSGFTNDEIAVKLHISGHTVKTHIYNIFKKINVPNRHQAALWAAKNL